MFIKKSLLPPGTFGQYIFSLYSIYLYSQLHSGKEIVILHYTRRDGKILRILKNCRNEKYLAFSKEVELWMR